MTSPKNKLAGCLLLLWIAVHLVAEDNVEEPAKQEAPADPFGNIDKNDLFSSDPSSDSATDITKQLAALVDNPQAAMKILAELPNRLSEEQSTALRQLDRAIKATRSADHRKLAREILSVLARSGDVRSLGYVHQVFEESPGRRGDVAEVVANLALSGRLRAEDWRLLVRSLPIVEGQPARDVLQALLQFNQRSNNGTWQRHAILTGLRLNEDGAGDAIKLLQYWTNEEIGAGQPVSQALAEWQVWLHRRYPYLPPAELPSDPPDAKHRFDDLLAYLQSEEGWSGDAENGAKVYETSQCHNCHRIGQHGESLGPDLTTVAGRLDDGQMLQSLLFPSHEIHDEYRAKRVLTVNGKVLIGVVNEVDDELVILPTDGNKVTINTSEVEEVAPSRISSMPAGLLDPLTREAISDLFAFLRHPSRQ